MNCKYCEHEYKNEHGLHIHWFYCPVKRFTGLEKVIVSHNKYEELIRDEYLMSINCYPTSFYPFIEKGEFGIKMGKRHILK